jgi:hypothetical protein
MVIKCFLGYLSHFNILICIKKQKDRIGPKQLKND